MWKIFRYFFYGCLYINNTRILSVSARCHNCATDTRKSKCDLFLSTFVSTGQFPFKMAAFQVTSRATNFAKRRTRDYIYGLTTSNYNYLIIREHVIKDVKSKSQARAQVIHFTILHRTKRNETQQLQHLDSSKVRKASTLQTGA